MNKHSSLRSLAAGLGAGLGALLLLSAPAHAASRYLRDQAGGQIMLRSHPIPAGVSATFETTNLRATSLTTGTPDTILHVLDDTWHQIAANDDCGGELRSCVTLPPSSVPRTVFVLVRAFSNSSFGLAGYQATVGGTVIATGDTSFGGTSVDAGFLPAGTRIETVQQARGFAAPSTQTGSNDTVVLALTTKTNLVAIDDDSGAITMSKLNLASACNSCTLVVADYPGSVGGGGLGLSTLLWTSDTLDSDGDGLSNELEVNVGSSANLKDTDGDGIPDGVEVLGLDDVTMRLPYFGALPQVKDLFVEIDYLNASWRWQGSDAETIARAFRVNGFRKNAAGALLSMAELNSPAFTDARDVRVHLDIGTDNVDSDENRRTWGAWGGSETVTVNADCQGLTPLRASNPYWHHLLANAGNSAGFGRCGRGEAGLTAAAHELGHQLGLEHGGMPRQGPNGSLAYASIMNYQFNRVAQDPAFSAKRWVQALNPSSVNDSTWGGTGTNKVEYVNSTFTSSRFFNNANQIDFNSDETYSSTAARGFGTFGRDTGNAFRNVFRTDGLVKDLEVAWLPGSPNRLYFFHLYTKGTTSRIEYRFTTNTASCDAKQPIYGSDCTTFQGFSQLAGTDGVKRFFGAERVNVNGAWKLMLVWIDATDRLHYLLMNASGVSRNALVPSGATVATGPGLVRSSDSRLWLFAGAGSPAQLQGWEYDASGDLWLNPRAPQTYSDGSAVTVGNSGVSLTRGYVKDTGSTVQLVGALTEGSGGQTNLIKMVRYNPSTKRWTLLTGLNASFPLGFWSDNKLGVAYVPYNPASLTTGRYYLMFNRPNGGRRNTFFVRTVGNDPNAAVDPATGLQPGALKWRRAREEYLTFEWDGTIADGGHDMVYDLDLDNHLRAGWLNDNVTAGNAVVFFPAADGHYNYDLTDYDDWAVLDANVSCSLSQSNCPRQFNF